MKQWPIIIGWLTNTLYFFWSTTVCWIWWKHLSFSFQNHLNDYYDTILFIFYCELINTISVLIINAKHLTTTFSINTESNHKITWIIVYYILSLRNVLLSFITRQSIGVEKLLSLLIVLVMYAMGWLNFNTNQTGSKFHSLYLST